MMTDLEQLHPDSGPANAVLVVDKAAIRRDRAVDWVAALLLAGGDIDFMKELVPVFLEQEVELVEALSSGIAAHNCTAVQQAAHSLKGAIANFTQGPAYERASNLEKT